MFGKNALLSCNIVILRGNTQIIFNQTVQIFVLERTCLRVVL